MLKEQKQFPRTFRSSSAAYRAVYQYEDKLGLKRGESGLVMTKIDSHTFLMSLPTTCMSVEEFNEKRPVITYPDGVYRYFPDGKLVEGYYELKKGDRRRPNSKVIPCEKVYTDLVKGECKI